MCFSCYLCYDLRVREAAQNVSCVLVPWEPGVQACGPPEPQVPGMSPEQQEPQEVDNQATHMRVEAPFWEIQICCVWQRGAQR